MAVIIEGELWVWGFGEVLTVACDFGNAQFVSVACGASHSALVAEEGTLYTWGEASDLGHADGEAKWVPTRIT